MSNARALSAARVAAAALMLASLAGLGPRWLPLAGILVVIALDPAVADAVLRAREAHGWSLGVGAFVRRRWFEVSLVAIALLGLAVRLVGIGVGVGHEPTDVDERRLAMSVLEFFKSGALGHETSEDHPGLHFWLLSAGGMGGYLWALMTGVVRGIDDAPAELFLLAGRVVNVVLATGTAVLTGLMGRAVAGPAAGLLAAGIVVMSPLSLETSTLLRNDVGMAFLVMACVTAALATCDRPRRHSALAMGVLAGVAAGTKITAVFVLLPALLAAALPHRGGPRAKALGCVVAGFLAALAVSNHFIWSDFSNFVRQVSMDYGHVQRGHFAFTDAPRLAYASLLAGYGVGWPLMVVAAAFATYGLATAHRRAWVLLAFPVSYLWFMTLKPAVFTRWMYVLVPFIAVAGAGGLVGLYRWAARLPGPFLHGPRAAVVGRIVGVAICLAGLYPIAWPGAIQVGRRFTAPTYALAEAWITANVPKGDRVLAESGVLDLAYPGLQVVRVEDLRGTLARNAPELRTCKWIVVPEYQFDIPGLSDLFLVKAFVANPGFGGNRGMDVRV